MKPGLLLRPAGPEVAVAAHAHRWRIEEPCGPTSPGRCRVFRNSPAGDEFTTNEGRRAAATGQPLSPPSRAYVPAEAEPALV